MASPTTVDGPARLGALDRYFKITERGSTIGTEIRGGVVTFFAMAYIVVLNPAILGGVPDGVGNYLGGGDAPNLPAIAATTALVAGVLSIAMGAVANFPLAIAAGLGLNAVVAFTIAPLVNSDGVGMTWPDAMGLVVISGFVILLLVMTGFREAVFKAVPRSLKTAISVGIGLFIAMLGFVNGGFVAQGEGTPVQLGATGSLSGWPILVFVVGLVLMIVLSLRKVKGALLIGIAAATVLAVVVQLVASVPLKSDDHPNGWQLTVPELSDGIFSTPDFSLIGQFSLLGGIQKFGPLVVIMLVFSLLLADFFDTMGTMVAVGAEAGLLDESGKPPKTPQILIVDAVACSVGGAASVSSNTGFVESASGVGEGARTGLASVMTGLCFLLTTFLSPLVEMVPQEAATPVLVFVGFLMMTQVTGIKWTDWEIAIPAFLTIALMPFTYSITVGLGAGFVSFVIIKLALGKVKEIHPLMWITGALFIVYFTLGPIRDALGI